MSKKEVFITMVEKLLEVNEELDRESGTGIVGDGISAEDFTDALAYFEALKTSVDKKDKPAFTDNGKLILKTMIENVEEKQNMFKARDIAELAFISSRSVSGSIRKLVTDGYVEKMGQDPIVYALTDLGRGVSVDELN